MLRKVALAAIAATTLALVACGGSGGSSQSSPSSAGGCSSPTSFKFRLNWVLDTEQVAYYTALDKGWYKDACLDPQFQPGNGSTTTVQLVANGSADMGVADAISIIPGQSKGLPVTAVGAVFQHNAFALVIRQAALAPEQKSQQKLDPSVLYGKTFGAVPGSSPFILWQAFVKQQHLDTSKIKQVSISAPGYAEMATGKVDFLANFFTAKAVLDGAGTPVALVKGEDYGQKAYGLTYLVNDDWGNGHAKQIADFLKVTQRALQYTSDHPEEGVKELCKYNQTLCQDQHNTDVNVAQWKETIPLFPNLIKGKPMLCIDTNTWKSTEDVVKQTGVADSVPDSSKSFTNKYLSGC
ncbi:MAG: ABC transporter substrate-binding protein [Candidatus Dormibacteraeota bacterium]|uniref:ABC transporter substrate-binding protein n=1 Tax=Candidatus Dormiibacter inghamiae TaxID=3127013 RepID=A0A934NHB7_9BACT|nr:ABC transporter substrate-binding protein [Candidatus Dormibacteraeota bacterium]MBJ7606479.1 ABC transporter substrate-binding protein [Candidatus Dormibacteraeota bacterium]